MLCAFIIFGSLNFPACVFLNLDDIYREDIVFKDRQNSFQGLKFYKYMFLSLRWHGRIFFSNICLEIRNIWLPKDNVIRYKLEFCTELDGSGLLLTCKMALMCREPSRYACLQCSRTRGVCLPGVLQFRPLFYSAIAAVCENISYISALDMFEVSI